METWTGGSLKMRGTERVSPGPRFRAATRFRDGTETAERAVEASLEHPTPVT